MLFADGADGMAELGLDLIIGADKYWLMQKKNHWLWFRLFKKFNYKLAIKRI